MARLWLRDRVTYLTGVIILSAILLAVTVYSCSENHSGPALRVGTNVWPGYEPLYLARHLKLYDENLLYLVEYSSSSQVMRALRNGVIDAAGLTLDEAILLKDLGLDMKILAVMDISNGADAIIAQSGIEAFSDLKHRKIGVENTALGALFLARALEEHGMTAADVEIVPLEIDEQFQAFVEHQIDAVVTFEPVLGKLLELDGRRVFHSGQIPGEIVDVLLINARYLNQANQKRVNELLNSWYAALAYFNEQPEQSAKQIGRRLKLSTEQVLASYQGLILPDRKQNSDLLSHKEHKSKLLLTAEKLVEVMYENHLIEHKVDASSLFVSNQVE
ncbi:MAG TPA: ABC transporter substrate-binding protein [Gammaproteobacteria bacterium]